MTESLSYDLHKLGWRAFQDLSAVMPQAVLGAIFKTFASLYARVSASVGLTDMFDTDNWYSPLAVFLDPEQPRTIRFGGTAVTRIIPPAPRFSADASHGEKKQRVLSRLGEFFERFFGLSSGAGG